ncbi:DUF3613 domain-containing protein [Bordetella pertussis]
MRFAGHPALGTARVVSELQGPVASAAWQRYLESFSQPIPQWFGERIEDNVGGSGGGGG